MKERLLQYIVCPHCKAEFDLHVEKKDSEEILEGRLDCSSCQSVYRIIKGIPRILPAEISEDQKDTARAFEYEWKHFTELTDKYESQFLDWIKPITQDFFKDKVVLDAGCGKGRHVWLSAKFGAKDVIGIDLSEAVEVAYKNTRNFPNVHIIQADIYNLPFRTPFDYAYSIGVLHHLPDPEKGFSSVVKHIKMGGRISAWVYGKEGNGWIEKIVNPIRIIFTSKIPKFITKLIAFFVALPMQAALKLIYKPINRHATGLKRFLFYNDYLYSISDFSFTENYSIVFDHLVAPTAFYIAGPEFRQWFDRAKLSDVQTSQRNSNSWRGTGIKNDT